MKSIRVLAITGIRSEYDILYPVIKSLSEDNRFELKLVVSAAHLSTWHGNTLEKIENDGFHIADKIDSLYMTNRVTQRIKGIGALISALTQTVEREKPDILLDIADREESIAMALVGNYMNILVAHIMGGDPVYGNADDPIRFAVSDLAHIHFPICEEYSENLRKIGEESFRIFNVGNPSLDNIRVTKKMSLNDLSENLKLDINDGKYIVFIKHPLSSEKEDAGYQMSQSLKALRLFSEKYGFKVVCSYPNTDPGSYDLLSVIDDYHHYPFIKFFKTLPHDQFVNLIRNTKVLIGNSSMGLLEAPYYKIPVINIGNRQKGRLNAGQLEFVDYEVNNIIRCLEKACFDESYIIKISNLKNPFGDGHTAKKIVDILASIDLDDRKWYVKKKIL